MPFNRAGEAVVTKSELSLTETFLRIIAGLAPEVEASKSEMDAERRLPQPLVKTLENAGLFSLWLPREFGGPELDLPDTVKVIEATARLDGATGWCVCNGGSVSRFAAYLPSEVTQKIFVDTKAMVAGRLGPVGKARAVPGGYRMSGQWNYA